MSSRPVSRRLPRRVRFVTFSRHHPRCPNHRIGFVSSNSAVSPTPARPPTPAPGSFCHSFAPSTVLPEPPNWVRFVKFRRVTHARSATDSRAGFVSSRFAPPPARPNHRIGFVSSNSAVPLTPARPPASAPGSFCHISRRQMDQRCGIRENMLHESLLLHHVSFQQLTKILVTLPPSVLIIVNGFRSRRNPSINLPNVTVWRV